MKRALWSLENSLKAVGPFPVAVCVLLAPKPTSQMGERVPRELGMPLDRLIWSLPGLQ